ncbi:KdsC family phosphatase [Nitrosopumilus sp. S6]
MISKKLSEKCKKIVLIITDVDGVLTDGGRYFSENGESLKRFHVQDGMGVNILLRNNIKTIILTKEKSKIVKNWGKSMNVSYVIQGSKIKENELPKICKKFNVSPEQIAYIGDDVNDVNLLEKVGFSATPFNGNIFVKKNVDYVCKQSGGNGSFREICDLILSIKFPKKKKWY